MEQKIDLDITIGTYDNQGNIIDEQKQNISISIQPDFNQQQQQEEGEEIGQAVKGFKTTIVQTQISDDKCCILEEESIQ
ncbi:hypothetical protein TTHERM_00039040 (macronuclear) [Tetrahymena thermophila SB210]|uniref:Uncharacterized protein n=1 Tax=Tetrahymena thermophila (strain SB210) TaxID=312017 RepID=Q22M15_TETTS|nr:hypothetical protein TTHERM_00039040 [Tetrahymena thermophila SB210]EAR86279.1 hypothetical protein TTHERM_00039040 [Tetrahymena thermophila SB210]|eukprot:XP_977205.1 hypothetical protein TTHERM_00039040 [Tetrahymena thermophila SB210]